MSLKSQITEDMKTAMRAKDAARLSTIRMLLAAIKQREIDERIELTDADVLSIIDKMIKQRRDSIAQFEAGKRCEIPKEYERFVVLSTSVVRAGGSVGGPVCAHDMLIGKKVSVPERFNCLGVVPECFGVGADVALRKHHAESHDLGLSWVSVAG